METNQLTLIADQWTGLCNTSLYWNEFLNRKLRMQAFLLDKAHKLNANKTFRWHPQSLEHHLNLLNTLSLILVSTGLYESSLKGFSKHTLNQTNCAWFVFERWFENENDFSKWISLGKLLKTFGQSFSNVVLFSYSVLFSWNYFLLKFRVVILHLSFSWYGKFWWRSPLYSSFAVLIHILTSTDKQFSFKTSSILQHFFLVLHYIDKQHVKVIYVF